METQKSQGYWLTVEVFEKQRGIQKWGDLPKGVYRIEDDEMVMSVGKCAY